jgi:hypothetical protein
MIQPLGLQAQFIGLGIFRGLNAQPLAETGGQTGGPAALLEALAPARICHRIVGEVELRGEGRIENVPRLAVPPYSGSTVVRGAGRRGARDDLIGEGAPVRRKFCQHWDPNGNEFRSL